MLCDVYIVSALLHSILLNNIHVCITGCTTKGESKRVQELLNKEADRTILHSPLDYISLNHYVQI